MNDESVVNTFSDVEWLPTGATMRLIRSRRLPAPNLITSVHLFCFSGDALLLVEHNARGWDIPGGHVEPGEDLQSALQRELLEEAAAIAERCELFAHLEIDAGPLPPAGYRYPTPRSYICCFIGELTSLEEFTAAHETTQRRLFMIDEVRGLSWYQQHSGIYELALETRLRKDAYARRVSASSMNLIQTSKPNHDPVVMGLTELLAQHSDKRVCVVGTTCTGKSTMLSQIPGARDQDREVFPKLTKEESDFVCRVPWTEETGRAMSRFVREKVLSHIGGPVFGTVVIESDLVVLLKISDELLKQRVAGRNVQFSDAKSMQTQMESEVRRSGIPYIEYSVG